MKGKEALKIIKDNKGISFCEAYAEPLNAIEKDLDRLETFDYIAEQNVELREENIKLKKAIEILEDKTIHFMFLKRTLDVETYNKHSDTYNYDKLTEEQYNLLKEVLGNE